MLAQLPKTIYTFHIQLVQSDSRGFNTRMNESDVQKPKIP